MSGVGASLKVALKHNKITVEQLVLLPETEALRLPYVGRKVLKEAVRIYTWPSSCGRANCAADNPPERQ